ncbi:beta-glucosidase family protein [Paraburkholderia fungorum]|uniref:beta-glucosidase family protein n=1 Tax=Paraburkholderia fungorum TaxID=134537 RepID=UPI0038B6B2E5
MAHPFYRYAAIVSACAAAILSAACGSGDNLTDHGTATDQRAAALVAQMSLDEKILLVHGTGFQAVGAGYIPGIPRLGIPPIYSADSAGGVNVANVGATALPAPIALAASWDPQLANEYGARIATELRTLGYAEGLGGGINLAREPRDGRTFEFMGEDPVLAGTLSAARTTGTQSQKVIATVKHYAMNDQETNRYTSNSQVEERTMRETELLAFEIAVKQGQPGNVMCSYNQVNGTYACENPYLLTDVLKTEWGFKGIVQSDWTATHSTAPAALAGLDEEQPGAADDNNIPQPIAGITVASYFNTKLKAAVTAGTVPMARLNDMVQRKLRTLILTGIMDSPPASGGTVDESAGNALALQVEQQSAVLLKNSTAAGAQQAVLPLAAANLSSIVVIGGHADVGVLSGGGSGGTPAANGNAVSGCQQPTGVLFGGCAKWYKSAPLAAIKAAAPNANVSYLDGNDANAAASAAAQADVAIVFATQWETEGLDLPSLSLPDSNADPYNQKYDQNALIATVAAKAKRVIVVLENGSPVLMPWINNVHAVLETWYPGVQGGQAISDLLFGTVNPSGKLPVTFPVQNANLPQSAISATNLNVNYSEGLMMGYRWYDAQKIQPLFPFGFGLSYTTFSYSGMTASTDGSGNVIVTFTVKNTGARAGAETAQVYAALPSGLGEPPKRLVGWQKVTLQPGQSQQVSIVMPLQRFATWDVTNHTWKLNAGTYGLTAGTSSRDASALSSSVALAAIEPVH